ncbi:hypothetical protein FACS189426_05030 [Bacteroidia bacterium]|nr:hypothetical protein FACS189426_05030 [Bacteroidia bacterium]
MTKSRVRLEQQLDNQLQRCNIRFSNYVSNQGNNVSMRKIIRAIISGERDPVKLLPCTIPGVQKFSALCILAEIGNDMSAFQKANALVGWSGLRPRNEESAGKIQSRKTLHGNKYLRQILVIIFNVLKTKQPFDPKKNMQAVSA